MNAAAQLLQTKKIKEIVDFLNSLYPNLFYGLLNRTDGIGLWHIVCMDWDIYMKDEDFKDCKEAIRIKFPELKAVFCYLAKMSEVSAKKLTEYPAWTGKSVIIIK